MSSPGHTAANPAPGTKTGDATEVASGETSTGITASADALDVKLDPSFLVCSDGSVGAEDADGVGEEHGRDVRLLSNDLLDEIGPGTPSELSTPPRPSPAADPATPPGSCSTGPASDEVLTCVDIWDWKTDAPEFVPGGFVTKDGGASNSGIVSAAKSEPGPHAAVTGATRVNGAVGTAMASPMVASIWTVTQPAAARAMTWGTLVPVGVAKTQPEVKLKPPAAPASPGDDGSVRASAETTGGEAEVQQIRAHYEWQVQRQDEELQALQQRMGRLEERRADVKARWERERQGLVREISRYVAVLQRYAIPLEEACEGTSADELWPSMPLDMEIWSGDLDAATTKGHSQLYNERVGRADCIGTSTPSAPVSVHSAPVVTVPPMSSLDAKMRRLNGLLMEESPALKHAAKSQAAEPPSSGCPADGDTGEAASGQTGGVTSCGADGGAQGAAAAGTGTDNGASTMPPGSIASTLQAMFPHATIRTKQDARASAESQEDAADGPAAEPSCVEDKREGCMAVLGDGEVGQLADELERLTKSQIDDRALRALQGLSSIDACGVLRKVDDLVKAQGGRCRNLSSILQSVCRKLERRAAGRGDAAACNLAATGSTGAASSGGAVAESGERSSPSRQKCGGETGAASQGVNSSGEEGAESAEEQAVDRGNQTEAADSKNMSRSRRSRARRKRRSEKEDSDAEAKVGELRRAEPANSTMDEARLVVEPESMPAMIDVDSSAGEDGHGHGRGRPAASATTASDLSESRVPRSTRGRIGRRGVPLHVPEQGDDGSSEATAEDFSKSSSSCAARDYWTTRRVERAAEKAFELKRRDNQWELKISMGSLDPPLTEAGMERYCHWLRARLSAIRKEHGSQVLRRCCGEVDFSNNGLNNQAVWMLLETLAQHEVHAASLKLYKNRISQGGTLAICEFIRTNKRAQAVYEMHLSHNEIDDDSAHELLRTLHKQRSRYPPKRILEGGAASSESRSSMLVPVWVRLNHNRIMNPHGTLRELEAEGITYCTAKNSHGCGPGKCSRVECPLVHLYLFADQAARRRDKDASLRTSEGVPGGVPAGAAAATITAPAAKGSCATGGIGSTLQSKASSVAVGGVAAGAGPIAAESGAGGETGSSARRKRGRKSRHREQMSDGATATTPFLVPPPPPPGPPPPIQHQ